ncbi:hypothetical protein DV515_00017071 [Chloebia gouldiae]|uniref:Uncharacterized protein n=1 Tax=Chloebia gouldiae TaxID=44316 RepID=A0A3L8R9Q9_CHLGU|nr:hypothetical protein DV515_00017070 [Chloebia gouldiae]RLV76348.1 hypothetical protein DV515_00017071 [Chloebia gouldiae]
MGDSAGGLCGPGGRSGVSVGHRGQVWGSLWDREQLWGPLWDKGQVWGSLWDREQLWGSLWDTGDSSVMSPCPALLVAQSQHRVCPHGKAEQNHGTEPVLSSRVQCSVRITGPRYCRLTTDT